MADEGFRHYSQIMATLDNLTNMLQGTDPKTLSLAQKSDIEYYIERHIQPIINRLKRGEERCSYFGRSTTRAGIAS